MPLSNEMKKDLTPEQQHIVFEKGTERPFTGVYNDFYEPGQYNCVVCKHPLFSSETKYDSRSGWPSFTDVIKKGNVKFEEDLRYGMVRTEVLCANCGAHLGHVFNDGPTPDGTHYCVNSAALDFESNVAKSDLKNEGKE